MPILRCLLQPKRGLHSASLLTSFLLLLILLSACNFPWQPLPTPTPTVQCAMRSSNPITLTMYYSSEKESWIKDVVATFNSRRITVCNGPITVKALPTGSGESMQQIVNGTIKPDIWSPASRIWLALIEEAWQQKYGTQLISTVATDTPSLVQSPVVIAMWKSEAQALGWRENEKESAIGWSDIARLSINPRGWATYGHPEWGKFKFGHTRPDTSNSGLDAVIAENYAGSSDPYGLTIDDVNNPKTKEFVANIENSIIYYGDDSTSTGFLAEKMFCNGFKFLSAAVMYENLVIEGNSGTVEDNGKPCQHLADQIVAIYPKDGTFYSDHPFVIPQASWITPGKRLAARAFRDFLLSSGPQKKALQYGFRPAVGQSRAPIDSTHGVDPKQPLAILNIPPTNVVKAIQRSWENLRRKVDIMLILDKSGSMNETVNKMSKIKAAKQGLVEFVNLLGDSDELGLTIFSDNAQILTRVSSLGEKRESMLSIINGIMARGQTRLFDTIYEQWQALQQLSSRDIKASVVLTDGIDNISQLTLDQLIQKITPSGSNAGEGVKVFTIAYGNDVATDDLKKIAQATGAAEYTGTPQNIQQIYFQISRLL